MFSWIGYFKVPLWCEWSIISNIWPFFKWYWCFPSHYYITTTGQIVPFFKDIFEKPDRNILHDIWMIILYISCHICFASSMNDADSELCSDTMAYQCNKFSCIFLLFSETPPSQRSVIGRSSRSAMPPEPLSSQTCCWGALGSPAWSPTCLSR